MIPLIIIAFITVGMAELGQKANRLFGLTLLLAYGTTTISGFLTFFIGKAFLPSLIKPITGDVLESNAFEPFFTIEVTPIFGVMTALVLAFVLGIGMANLKGDSMLKVFRDLQNIVSGVLRRVIIPLIPVHIAGLFANIAAEGRLAATVKMFASLYGIIIVLQLLYILSQFVLASWYSGSCLPSLPFTYGAFTLSGRSSQDRSVRLGCGLCSPNPGMHALRFGLFPVRSPLLRKSTNFLSLPPAT